MKAKNNCIEQESIKFIERCKFSIPNKCCSFEEILSSTTVFNTDNNKK